MIWLLAKAVNRGDKRTQRVRDRVCMKSERPSRYRYRYRYQKKKARRSRARDLVLREPSRRERARDRCSRLETPPPLPPALHMVHPQNFRFQTVRF
jgi:hypothetical protein